MKITGLFSAAIIVVCTLPLNADIARDHELFRILANSKDVAIDRKIMQEFQGRENDPYAILCSFVYSIKDDAMENTSPTPEMMQNLLQIHPEDLAQSDQAVYLGLVTQLAAFLTRMDEKYRFMAHSFGIRAVSHPAFARIPKTGRRDIISAICRTETELKIYHKSAQYCRKAVLLTAARDQESLYNLIRSESHLGRWNMALYFLNMQIEKYPLNANLYMQRAKAKMKSGNWESAIQDAYRVAIMEPRNGKANAILSRIFFRLNEIEKGCQEWQQAQSKGVNISDISGEQCEP